MTKRERMLVTLSHKEPEIIPSKEEFMDPVAEQKFVPDFNSGDWEKDMLNYAEFMDDYMIGIVPDPNQKRPGKREAPPFGREVIKRGDNFEIWEFENGAVWKIILNPWTRVYLDYPIKEKKDIDKIVVPDPNDPMRYEGLEEKTKFFKEAGYFTYAAIDGFFSGVWYFYRDFENFLTDLLLDPDFAHELIAKRAEYNLAAAKNLLEIGVDCIFFYDDLGSTDRMLISPENYRKFFFPWHKKLASLCHSYDAYVHMHSHGHIMEIIDLIVEAGIDILNPVGPGDGMDLGQLKRRYGDKITFLGGISKNFYKMTPEQMENHIEKVIRVGHKGGGFIPRTESGIPAEMSIEKFHFYLDTMKKYREKYGVSHKQTGE